LASWEPSCHGFTALTDYGPPMELVCYLHPGWEPLIRPAEPTREWMAATPEAFAYRCLPLNIANAHGWEVLCPCSFEARWWGGIGTDQVEIKLPADAKPDLAPVSLFGQGVLTFHIAGLFRTPPGWNLWVGGPPNRPKASIYPLTGVVETDWAPFTFTMNWRFTRTYRWVRFEAGEPICFFFPVQRGYLQEFIPNFVPMESDPVLMEQFKTWSKSRDAFHAQMRREMPQAESDKWQKHYYRGTDVTGRTGTDDHQSKLRLAPFGHRSAAQRLPPEPAAEPAAPAQPAAQSALLANERDKLALEKRDWLLNATERHWEFSRTGSQIERRLDLSRDEFLERYYAPGRPVILVGEMANWPALSCWTPQYLRDAIRSEVIEFQGGRTKNDRFEIEKDVHRRELAFDQFIDLITGTTGNDAYITAYNSARNAEALAPLQHDLGFLDKFLSRESGMMWIGPAGTLTALHHDLTDNLIAQIVGRKRLKLAPAADVAKLYNNQHVFSEIADLEDPALDPTRFPLLADARVYDVTLSPGEIIFVPLAWWHQVKSLDFSITITYTNFLWPNDSFKTYPQG
jgi:Family of unknown function (DUF6065)/Cupin-like domain